MAPVSSTDWRNGGYSEGLVKVEQGLSPGVVALDVAPDLEISTLLEDRRDTTTASLQRRKMFLMFSTDKISAQDCGMGKHTQSSSNSC